MDAAKKIQAARYLAVMVASGRLVSHGPAGMTAEIGPTLREILAEALIEWADKRESSNAEGVAVT